MATVQTQRIREERWRENYKDDGSSNKDEQTGRSPKNGLHEIQDHTEKNRSTNKNMNKYPQVKKNWCRCSTWKLPTDGLNYEEM